MEVVEAPFQIGLSCRAVKLEGLERISCKHFGLPGAAPESWLCILMRGAVVYRPGRGVFWNTESLQIASVFIGLFRVSPSSR